MKTPDHLTLTRKERRAEVRRLFFRLRMPMQRIARKLGVSRYTIWRDVRLWREQDPQLGCKNSMPTMAELYREIEELKQEAWRAYGRSQEPQVVEMEGWSRPAPKPASSANSTRKPAQPQVAGRDTVVSAEPVEPALIQRGTELMPVDTQLQQIVTGGTRVCVGVTLVNKDGCRAQGVPNRPITIFDRWNGSLINLRSSIQPSLVESALGPPHLLLAERSRAPAQVKQIAFST